MGEYLQFDVLDLAPNVLVCPDLGNIVPLGEAGRFASVWRAGLHGEYAIKSFHDATEDEVRSEFDLIVGLNEAGCSCAPRAICTGIFVDGRGEAHYALVEQYIDGRTLAQVLEKGLLSATARKGTLAPAQGIEIALEMAKALSSIAECGLAHRDLSPRNVMLTSACIADELRDGAHVYLVDFGQSTPTDGRTVTPGAPRLATIPYGAPEIFGGEYYSMRNDPEKCDVWSLGSLIATMLAGEYWPREIADLRDSEWGVTDEGLVRVANAKRVPIDLATLLESSGVVLGVLERKLSDVVSACTNYDPLLRPALKNVILRLSQLSDSSDAVPPDSATPRFDMWGAKQGVRSRPGAHISRGIPKTTLTADRTAVSLGVYQTEEVRFYSDGSLSFEVDGPYVGEWTKWMTDQEDDDGRNCDVLVFCPEQVGTWNYDVYAKRTDTHRRSNTVTITLHVVDRRPVPYATLSCSRLKKNGQIQELVLVKGEETTILVDCQTDASIFWRSDNLSAIGVSWQGDHSPYPLSVKALDCGEACLTIEAPATTQYQAIETRQIRVRVVKSEWPVFVVLCILSVMAIFGMYCYMEGILTPG